MECAGGMSEGKATDSKSEDSSNSPDGQLKLLGQVYPKRTSPLVPVLVVDDNSTTLVSRTACSTDTRITRPQSVLVDVLVGVKVATVEGGFACGTGGSDVMTDSSTHGGPMNRTISACSRAIGVFEGTIGGTGQSEMGERTATTNTHGYHSPSWRLGERLRAGWGIWVPCQESAPAG